MKKLLGNVRWTTYTGRLHVGIDMLAEPPILSLVDDSNYQVHERRRLPARRSELISQLRDAGSLIADVVVLAQRGHYDLVDDLAEAGFVVYLLTPAELRRFAGLRNVHSSHDAYWIAHLLRSGALPHGEIYWTGDINETGAYPRHFRRLPPPPLAGRLRVDEPQVVKLTGKSLFYRR
ncbi:MAG: hypothetical protein KJO54_05835 [Gammaproteobacteria bacterium]|nr:hypothetical protein [Gammaproteobacteria bacterium]NNF61473.1 hypothetical protein [Gammaproteobacteria bacterium]